MLVLAALAISCKSYTTTLKESPSKVDEGATISTLRSIYGAQTAYSVSNDGNYGTFKELVAGGYLDQRFNSSRPVLYGYAFTISTNAKSQDSATATYSCNADPQAPAVAKGRHFYINSSSLEMHVNENQPASANDPIVQP